MRTLLEGGVKKRILEILLTSDTVAMESFLAMLKIIWGIFELFPLSETASSRVISQAIPSWIFGIVLLLAGFSRLYGIIVNSRSIRRTCAFISMGLWIFVVIATLLATSFTINAGIVLLIVIALYAIWVYLRLSSKG